MLWNLKDSSANGNMLAKTLIKNKRSQRIALEKFLARVSRKR